MVKQTLALAVVALGVGACATEHRTVVVTSSDACTRYGFTASTDDYVHCQRMIAEQRRAPRVVVYSNAQIMADSRAACASYGIPHPSANFDRCVQDEFAARRPG